jgi:ABC-type dipeptide/oligopeptide/nickel transport system permease subunit
MQAQQEFRINAAPLTATFVLVVGLALGAIGGYAIGTAERSMTHAIPSAPRAVPQFPAATQPPVSEPQNSHD